MIIVFKLTSLNQLKRDYFDRTRGRVVVATPEEQVRQSLLFQMESEKGYPRAMMVVEREISKLPHLTPHHTTPTRRIDLLIYAKEGTSLKPLLLVECKQEAIERGSCSAAFQQLQSYNHYVAAPFVALAGSNGFFLCLYDKSDKKYHISQRLPTYSELLEWVKTADHFPENSF